MYNWRESAYHRAKATGLKATLPSASRQIRLPALHFGSTSVTTTTDRDLSPSLTSSFSCSPFHPKLGLATNAFFPWIFFGPCLPIGARAKPPLISFFLFATWSPVEGAIKTDAARRGACTEVVKVLTEPGRFFTCQVPHGQTWILQPRNYARRGTARCPAATRDSSTHASTAFMLLNVIIGTMNYSGSCRIIVCSTSSRQKTRRNLGRCIVLIYFRPRVSWMKMWLFVVTLVNLDNVCPIRRWTHLRTVLQSAYPDKALRQAAPTNSRVTLDHRPTSLLTQLLLPFHGFLRCGLTLDSLWRFSSVAFSVLDPRVLAKSLIHLQRNLCFCKFVFSSIRSARESG